MTGHPRENIVVLWPESLHGKRWREVPYLPQIIIYYPECYLRWDDWPPPPPPDDQNFELKFDPETLKTVRNG